MQNARPTFITYLLKKKMRINLQLTYGKGEISFIRWLRDNSYLTVDQRVNARVTIMTTFTACTCRLSSLIATRACPFTGEPTRGRGRRRQESRTRALCRAPRGMSRRLSHRRCGVPGAVHLPFLARPRARLSRLNNRDWRSCLHARTLRNNK